MIILLDTNFANVAMVTSSRLSFYALKANFLCLIYIQGDILFLLNFR